MSTDSSNMLHVEVWRGARSGHFQSFSIPRRTNQTVLDVVTEIQREQDPTLSYRFACRVGMCGSCAMVVNGHPRWTCRTRVSEATTDGRLRLEPLRNLAVVKDLAVDMTDFFDKWRAARGFFEPGDAIPADFHVVPPQTEERRAADEAVECIGCGICYSACDVVAWDESYLGPAALNRAWTLVNDARDKAQAERLDAIASSSGCYACHTHMSCTTYCPKALAPTYSIAGLKHAAVKRALRRRP
jgi:fumarate reductase iron-sulfur subunit